MSQYYELEKLMSNEIDRPEIMDSIVLEYKGIKVNVYYIE